MSEGQKASNMQPAWDVNTKTMFDILMQHWLDSMADARALRAKMEASFFGNQQSLDQVKVQSAQTGQVTNAVVQATLVESVMGRAIAEQSMEGKLAAGFPASVIEMATAFTDKMVSMVGVEAMMAIVKAIVAGKAEEEQ